MRRAWWIVAIVAAALLAAYVGGTRRTEGPPLDPRSTSPDGARAVVELIERLGADLTVVDGAPDDAADVALLLEDRLSRGDADAVSAWVRRGGVLVVADPNSLFTPPIAGSVLERVEGGCAAPALAGVAVLELDVGSTYDVPLDASGCFGTSAAGAFLVVEQVGEGSIVSVGGPDVFTNAFLGEADNAVLAAALLSGEARQAAFLRPSVAGGGERTLVDLIENPVRAALAQLVVVFVVVVLWRGRRLGRPITEPQPVQIESSELTRAVGRLLASNRRPARAAAIVRDRARRDLSGRLGLPLDAPAALVETTLVARTTLSEAEAHRAVSAPVDSDRDLVEVAHLLSRIREELTHDRSPTGRS